MVASDYNGKSSEKAPAPLSNLKYPWGDVDLTDDSLGKEAAL